MVQKAISRLLAVLTFTIFIDNVRLQHWSYTNPATNPQKWAEEGFPQCGGYYQSPIDVVTKNTVPDSDLKSIKLFLKEGKSLQNVAYKVTNNGHTVKIDFPEDTWYISLEDNKTPRYSVLQMHFHWGSDDSKGSEHTLDGNTYSMETHIVSYDTKMFSSYQAASTGPFGHVVLAIWSAASSTAKRDQTQFGQMGQFEEKIKAGLEVGKSVTIPAFDLSKLIDQVDDESYYRYAGSLTTPGCTQNVLWTVFTKLVPILPSQLTYLRNLPFGTNEQQKNMSNNFRPTQPLNPDGTPVPRTVFRSVSSRLLVNSFMMFCLSAISVPIS